MWTDRILAVISLALMISFLGILVVYVWRIDLTIVIVSVVTMAAYDFYRELSGGGEPHPR